MTVRPGVRRARAFHGVLLLALAASAPANADERIWATGRIVDAAGKPLPGAMIAAYDDSGKIVDYSRTDSKGEYALAVPPHALHLDTRHGPGFFAEVAGKVARFVTSSAGKALDAAQSTVHALTATQALVLPSAAAKPVVDMSTSLADKTFQTMKGERGRPHKRKQDVKIEHAPGDLAIKAVAPNYADLTDVTRVFWAQRETPGEKGKPVLAAWLDTIKLEPTDSGKKSGVEASDIKFSALKIEPSLAPIGQAVKLTATLPTPSDPPVRVVVAARDMRTGKVWQLEPKGSGVYELEITIDKSFPPNDQVISAVAYPANGATMERRPEVEKAVESAGLWDPAKAYKFNPLIVVSHNRATAILSVAVASGK